MCNEVSPKEKKIESWIKKHFVYKQLIFDYNSIQTNVNIPRSITSLPRLYFFDKIITYNDAFPFMIGKVGSQMFFLEIETLLPTLNYSFTNFLYENKDSSFVFVEIEGKWGVFDLSIQNFCIPPLYDKIESNHKICDYFVVKQNGKYGLVDNNGHLIIDIVFDKINLICNNIIKINKEGYIVSFNINEKSVIKPSTLSYNEGNELSNTFEELNLPEKIINVETVDEKIQKEKDYYQLATGRVAYDMLNKQYVNEELRYSKVNEKYLSISYSQRRKIPNLNSRFFSEGDEIYIGSDINNLFATDYWNPAEGGVFALKKGTYGLVCVCFMFKLLYGIWHEFKDNVQGNPVETGRIIVPTTFFEHEIYDAISSFRTGQEIWNYLKGKTLRVIDVKHLVTGSNYINNTPTGTKIAKVPIFEIIDKDTDEIFCLVHGNYKIVSDDNGKYGIYNIDTNKVIVDCFFDKIKVVDDLVIFYLDNKESILRMKYIEILTKK